MSGSIVLIIFSMLLLISCRKSPAEMLTQQNGETASLTKVATEVGGGTETVPYERTVFVPCANNGAGEDVQLTGSVINVDKFMYNKNGFTLTYHTHTKGVKGIGLSTGEEYNATGGMQNTITGAFENRRFSGTTIEQLRIVGQHTNFIVRYHFHVTVTADGTYTSSISDDTAECK